MSNGDFAFIYLFAKAFEIMLFVVQDSVCYKSNGYLIPGP